MHPMTTTRYSVPTDELIQQLGQLPAQPTAALRVLWLLDDPDWSLGDLSRIIEADPALSTRVIHLANAPFYGLSAKVSSAMRAVTVLGQTTVRALAAVSAGGLLDHHGRAVPEGFWAHATAVAAGASTVARHLRVPASDAFTAGLLHDLGVALLHRHDPQRYSAVLQFAALDPQEHLTFEHQVFGTDHARAGGAVLQAWRFPDVLTEAVAAHHDPAGDLGALTRCVIAGEALAAAVGAPGWGKPLDPEEALSVAGASGLAVDAAIEATTREYEALESLQGWGV